MICPNCGSNNSQGTRFCIGCGAKLEATTPPPPPPPAYQQPPQQAYQPLYQQPIPAVDPNTAPMTTGDYFWMMLVLAIPLVGFICTLVWAFGSNVNVNRRNFCRATLIWMLVGIVLTIVLSILLAVLGFTLGDAFSSSNYY